MRIAKIYRYEAAGSEMPGNRCETRRCAASLLRGLANPHRLHVLCAIVDAKTPEIILERCPPPLSESLLSLELSELHKEGIIRKRHQGKTTYYTVTTATAPRVIRALRELYCDPPNPPLGHQAHAQGLTGPVALFGFGIGRKENNHGDH